MPVSDLSAELVLRDLGTEVIGRQGRYHPVTSSTQDLAQAAGRAGVPEGVVFIADRQTAGRGRLGRPWQAPPGGSLLLSVLLRPAAGVYPVLSMAGALATCRAIEETSRLRASLKWPNDVLVRDKKVAGVLVEGEVAGSAADFAALGIGINVNLDPASLKGVTYPVTSLSAELGRSLSRVQVAQSLLRHLERLYLGASSGESPYGEWRARLVTLGKRVRVDTGRGTDEGIAEDVDQTGALLLRRGDGSLLTLLAGEVTLQRSRR